MVPKKPEQENENGENAAREYILAVKQTAEID